MFIGNILFILQMTPQNMKYQKPKTKKYNFMILEQHCTYHVISRGTQERFNGKYLNLYKIM